MNSLKLIANHLDKLVPLGLSVFNPNNASVLFKNAWSTTSGQQWWEYIDKNDLDWDTLIQNALRWINFSQDKVGSGGVGCYEFYRWTPGYPEVTGYIIPTYWNCYHEYKDEALKTRALKMTDWELTIQRPNGGFEGFYEGYGQPPIVFNTGQVLRGLIRSYVETKEDKYLQAAVKAADWIVDTQDADGSWTSTNFKQMKRVYDTYVSAPLVHLYQITNDDKYLAAATKNCDFVLTQQHENGWFDLCDNTLLNNQAPVTHTISYTVDGLLETGLRSNTDKYIMAAQKAADALLHKAEILPYLPARLDKKWRRKANYVCNTGNAQLGIIFIRLYDQFDDPRYLNAALKLADFLAYIQSLNSIGKYRKGGIPGSYPIWGMYCPLKYPSWATKYFIDLMLLLKKRTSDASTR